jgi:hypothetical protein
MKKKMSLESKGKIGDLVPYSGKWVAFIDNLPFASDKNLSILMEKIKKARPHKEPSIMLVPRKDEGPYILNIFI